MDYVIKDHCSACGASLGHTMTEDAPQYDNCLPIAFFGGYGMFIEDRDYALDPDIENEPTERQTSKWAENLGSTFDVVLCHDCAHKLCEENPWLTRILQPEHGHSHTQDYWNTHPDHIGWDRPGWRDRATTNKNQSS